MMKRIWICIAWLLCILSLPAFGSDGYTITGHSGIMYFVAIDPAEKSNEDVYRYAVGKACAGKAICQVQYWVGDAPSGFPLNDAQIESKRVQWQQNLNTGLRRWLVNCAATDIFARERECM